MISPPYNKAYTNITLNLRTCDYQLTEHNIVHRCDEVNDFETSTRLHIHTSTFRIERGSREGGENESDSRGWGHQVAGFGGVRNHLKKEPSNRKGVFLQRFQKNSVLAPGDLFYKTSRLLISKLYDNRFVSCEAGQCAVVYCNSNGKKPRDVRIGNEHLVGMTKTESSSSFKMSIA